MSDLGAAVRRLKQSQRLVARIECGARAFQFARIVLTDGVPAEDPRFLPEQSTDLNDNEIRYTYSDGRVELQNFETGAIVSYDPNRIQI